MLTTVGLDEVTERIYRELLRRPSASSHELAASTGGTASQTGRALGRLERFGLARRVDGKRFVPINPETALPALVQRRRAELEADLNLVQADISDLIQDYRSGAMEAHPAGLIEVLTGGEAIRQRTMELWDTATEEILCFDQEPSMSSLDPGFDEILAEQPVLDRGVRIRAIYSREALELPRRLELVSRLVQLGEEARMLEQLPIKLRIYDRETAVLPLVADSRSYQNVAIIHRSALLDALIALFEASWAVAVPFGPPEPAVEPDDPDQDLLVVQMLAAGLKDQAIGRQLGVSTRTASRRVVRVLERLGVSTRFQAGAAAVRRGWIQ